MMFKKILRSFKLKYFIYSSLIIIYTKLVIEFRIYQHISTRDFSNKKLRSLAHNLNISNQGETITFDGERTQFDKLIQYFKEGKFFDYHSYNGGNVLEHYLGVNVPLINNFLYEGSILIKILDEKVNENRYIYILGSTTSSFICGYYKIDMRFVDNQIQIYFEKIASPINDNFINRMILSKDILDKKNKTAIINDLQKFKNHVS